MTAGDGIRAEACFRAALQIDPNLAEVHANLAFLLDERGAGAEAIACYARALALNPAIAQIHLNFGSLLASHKRLDEAETAFTHAILLEPLSPAGWSNLGGLYAGMKRDAEAELCCRQAMALEAGYAKARFNLAYVLLRQGRFEEGWQCLESRDWYGALQAHLDCPRWRGESLQGKFLFIGFEAGHGDMIQFGRYAAVLKRQGAVRITLLWLPGLEVLAPLWQVAGVQFVSLQKGAGEDQAQHPPAAHLAGALCKPCWVLLPHYKTDWRWLNDRADSPWYPGVLRLFRQSTAGDWTDVVADIQLALTRLASTSAAGVTP